MSKKLIDKMVPSAIEIVKNSPIVKNGVIESKYNGYISSFGASIIQAGLNSTVAFFGKMIGEGKDRKDILDAIWNLIETENLNRECNSIQEFVQLKDVKPTIMNATIALKLAIRVFSKAD